MNAMKNNGQSILNTVSDAGFVTGDHIPLAVQDVLRLEGLDGSYMVWTWKADTGHVQFGAHQASELPEVYSCLAEAIISAVDYMIKNSTSSHVEEVQVIAPGETPRWFLIRCLESDVAEFQPTRVVGSARDITTQKSAQLAVENKLFFIDTLMDALACPVFFKDENMVYRHCNRAFEAYLGLPREEILGKSVYDISPPEMAVVYHAADLALFESRASQIYEARVKAADGKLMDVMFHKAVVFNLKEEPKGIAGIIYDITDRVKAEKQLSRAMDVKDAIVDISHSIMSVDAIEELYGSILDRIISAMPMADSGCFLMLTSPDLLSVMAGNGIFAEDSEPILVPLESCLGCHAMNGDPNHCFTVNRVTEYAQENGFTLNGVLSSGGIQSMLYAPITSKGILSGFLAVGSKLDGAFDESDISIMEYVRTQLIQVLEKQNIYEKNTYLAKHDGLTGLLNRKCFDDLFTSSKAHALTHQEQFHLILIDLDRFKNINDSFGHHVGDAVLLDFSRNLKECFRESDNVARFGGDEFILLIQNTTAKDLELRLETLRTHLMATPFKSHGCIFTYGFSYGIAEFPLEGVELERLIKLVDYNLYVYKRFKDDSATQGQEL